MQLLVSVRDAREAVVAVASGPCIVDAKEPAHGALAPVSVAALAGIAAAVPATHALSVALGEPADADALEALVAERRSFLATRRAYLKFVPPRHDAATLAAFVARARAMLPDARVVVAAYADLLPTDQLPTLPPRVGAAGADALLLDTRGKGRALPALMPRATLVTLAAAAHHHGLVLALAGSLDAGWFAMVSATGADVVGVRGAACDGGREATLSAARLRDLHQALTPTPAPAATRW